MTTALERGEGAVSRPGCSLPLGKTWYSLCRRLGGPQGQAPHRDSIPGPSDP